MHLWCFTRVYRGALGIVFDTRVWVVAFSLTFRVATRYCWVSFSIPVMVMGYPKGLVGYRFRYPQGCVNRFVCAEILPIDDWVSFSIPVMVMGFPKAVLGIVFDTHKAAWIVLLVLKYSPLTTGYRFRYPWWLWAFPKLCWVSFLIPTMAIGNSLVVWGNLRALGVVFDTREY